MTYSLTLSASYVLLGLGLCLSSFEYLAIARRTLVDVGLLSWQVFRTDAPWSINGRLHVRVLDSVLGEQGFRVVLGLRAALSLCLVWLGATGVTTSPPTTAILIALLALTYLVAVRSPYGLDGAHQMHLVVCTGLALASTEPRAEGWAILGLAYIGIQLTLSYFIAGVFKLVSHRWRTGEAIVGVMHTRFYGHRRASRVFDSAPLLAATVSWLTIGFEAMFPVVWLSSGAAPVLVVIGITFHLSTALVMGLTDFVLAWAAAYPALLYLTT